MSECVKEKVHLNCVVEAAHNVLGHIAEEARDPVPGRGYSHVLRFDIIGRMVVVVRHPLAHGELCYRENEQPLRHHLHSFFRSSQEYSSLLQYTPTVSSLWPLRTNVSVSQHSVHCESSNDNLHYLNERSPGPRVQSTMIRLAVPSRHFISQLAFYKPFSVGSFPELDLLHPNR